jgi:hypothetical protein
MYPPEVPSDDPAAEKEFNRIAERVNKICEVALASGRPYLLSRLGLDLGKDVQTLKMLGFKGLADFIRHHSALQTLALAPVVGSRSVLAVVRKNGLTSNDTRSGDEPPVVLPPRPTPEPRYHYRFWAAFSVPPTHGRRYVDPVTFIFKAVPENEAPADGWLLIEDEYIAAADAENRDRVIKDNIARWLQKNGLDHSRFLQDVRSPIPSQQTLLSALVDSLDRRQLQTTTMALDVIATLLAKKI